MASAFPKELGMLVLYFSGWFIPSIGLTLYNKWFFVHWNGDGFQFPIFVTMAHFTSNALLSRLALFVFNIDYDHNISWRTWAVSMVPIGVGTSVDIVLSNLDGLSGYLYLSISLMTIIKSCVPIWILIWSFLLKLETPSIPLVVVILLITAGAWLAVADFSPDATADKGDSAETSLGIFLVLLATVASGMRWAMSQLLLQAGFTKMHPLAALRYTAPVCALTLLPAFLLVEARALSNSEVVADGTLAAVCGGLMAIAALMALMLITAEFQIIQVYSAVTMTVGGVVKELLTIGLAVMFFSEELTWNNLAGAGLVIIAVLYYAYHKTSTAKRTQPEQDLFGQIKYESAPSVPSVTMPIPKLELTIIDSAEPSTPTARLPAHVLERIEVEDSEARELLEQMTQAADDDCANLGLLSDDGPMLSSDLSPKAAEKQGKKQAKASAQKEKRLASVKERYNDSKEL